MSISSTILFRNYSNYYLAGIENDNPSLEGSYDKKSERLWTEDI